MHAILFPLLLASLPSSSVPPLTGPVVDAAGLLSAPEAERLADGLNRYREQTSNQLQVLIIPALPEGLPIEEYSIRVAEEWKLGTAEKDNGVLVVLSVRDRKWRIEVGGGLEGELTDIDASRIGREILVPAFQRGDYASGIAGTLQAIAGALGGAIDFRGLPPVQAPRRQPFGGMLPLIMFALFILFIGRGRRGGFLAGMILGNAFGRGGRGGGGGGWSGGGGGFSGGGAGGGW